MKLIRILPVLLLLTGCVDQAVVDTKIDDAVRAHERDFHAGGTSPPGTPTGTQTGSPPPSSDCTTPSWPLVDGGLCVTGGDRLYNTRSREKFEDHGSYFRVKQNNGTGTFIGGHNEGSVSWEAYYETMPPAGGGQHYHTFVTSMADRSSDNMRGIISQVPVGRFEIDELTSGGRLWANWGTGEWKHRFGHQPEVGKWYRWVFAWEYSPTSGRMRGTLGRDDMEYFDFEFMTAPGLTWCNYFFPLGHVEGDGGWIRFRNITVE